MNGAGKALRLDSKVGSLTPGQGGRHHHPRRHKAQRRSAQSSAGRGRVPDGPYQRRDGDRRWHGAQVEGCNLLGVDLDADCARSLNRRATTSFSAAGIPQNLFNSSQTIGGRSDFQLKCGAVSPPRIAVSRAAALIGKSNVRNGSIASFRAQLRTSAFAPIATSRASPELKAAGAVVNPR